MGTLLQIRQDYIEKLGSIYDAEEAKALFQIGVEALMGINKLQLSLQLQNQLNSVDETALQDLLVDLSTGKPIQHILGHAPFYGAEFLVNAHTLIPRPETEELVDLILRDHQNQENLRLIDIGTGSGCIAISLQNNLKNANTVAVDISQDALAIARENAKRQKATVDFRCLDILEWELTFADEAYDIIVSNPPYITEEEMSSMHHNVLQYEPHSALFVPQEAPLLFYDYIADFALTHLKPNGHLYFEINQFLAQETKDLMLKKGFKNAVIFEDINAVPRMLKVY